MTLHRLWDGRKEKGCGGLRVCFFSWHHLHRPPSVSLVRCRWVGRDGGGGEKGRRRDGPPRPREAKEALPRPSGASPDLARQRPRSRSLRLLVPQNAKTEVSR